MSYNGLLKLLILKTMGKFQVVRFLKQTPKQFYTLVITLWILVQNKIGRYVKMKYDQNKTKQNNNNKTKQNN